LAASGGAGFPRLFTPSQLEATWTTTTRPRIVLQRPIRGCQRLSTQVIPTTMKSNKAKFSILSGSGKFQANSVRARAAARSGADTGLGETRNSPIKLEVVERFITLTYTFNRHYTEASLFLKDLWSRTMAVRSCARQDAASSSWGNYSFLCLRSGLNFTVPHSMRQSRTLFGESHSICSLAVLTRQRVHLWKGKRPQTLWLMQKRHGKVPHPRFQCFDTMGVCVYNHVGLNRDWLRGHHAL